MKRRFRFTDPDEDTWYWFEVGRDGRALRQVVFEGAREIPPVPEVLGQRAPDTFEGMPGGAAVAAEQDQLALIRERFGLIGAQLHEAVYGVLDEDPVGEPPDAVPVTEAQFERAWRVAVRDRHFTRYDTGPLPEGTRLTGTVSALPWGPGLTGLLVDIGLPPLVAFVDVLHLPRQTEDWPPVGTVTEFEVTSIRFHTGLQVRLRPTATPPPGEPWPRPGPR
ncbi:hypothetical protein ACWD26_11015 [Streptomyces sp. NPDC002787]